MKDAPVTIWRNRVDEPFHMQVRPADQVAEGFCLHMQKLFLERDTNYGSPEYPRFTGDDGCFTVHWQMRDLAEATWHTYKPAELADILYNLTDEWETDPHVIDFISQWDDFYRPGYVLEEQRDDRYRFWRVWAPDYSKEELEKMFLKKFWSKSKYHQLEGEHNFSPLLKLGRNYDYLKAFMKSYAPLEDLVRLGKLRDNGKELEQYDEMRIRFTRDCHHPLILLYKGDCYCVNLFDTDDVSERMAALEVTYPSLYPEGWDMKNPFQAMMYMIHRLDLMSRTEEDDENPCD